MIAGVVLAAGRSSRMGSPKALLTLDGATFLGRIVEALDAGGCESVMVVTGPGESDASVTAEAQRVGAMVTTNPDPDAQQIDSLRLAILGLPREVEAILVTPVDAPGLSVEVVRELIEVARSGARLAVPVASGRRGHPIVFGCGLFQELLEDPLAEGARTVIRRHEAELVEVATADSDVLLDIDTPEQYRALFSRSDG